MCIRDRRYPWRGMMVDPARHFIPIKDLKKFVDLMAYYCLLYTSRCV